VKFLDMKRVDNILTRVYPNDVPIDIDKSNLLQRLNANIRWYYTRVTYAKAPKKRERSLETALAKLKRLQGLLVDLGADKTWLELPGAQSLDEALGGALGKGSNVNKALTIILSKQAPADKGTRALVQHIRAENPTEWLRGTALPNVYERCFRQHCTVGRESPCVRFVGAVLAELNLSCSRETIIRNIKGTRSSPGVRRKRSGGAVSQRISKSAPRQPGDASIK
jgi:hypothetical protein